MTLVVPPFVMIGQAEECGGEADDQGLSRTTMISIIGVSSWTHFR